MGLQRQTYLNNTPTQQDQAHSADQTKDEVGQVRDNGEGIASGGSSLGGEGGHSHAAHEHHAHSGGSPALPWLPVHRSSGERQADDY